MSVSLDQRPGVGQSEAWEPVWTARERRAQRRKQLREQFSHLREYEKEEMTKLVKKYEVLPDHYYGEKPGVGPRDLLDDNYMSKLGYQKWSPVCIWEWFSGSAALSAVASEQSVTHLPPVDHRNGFHVG